MHEKSDAQLLRETAELGSEDAFRELVQRHTDFVYSAALRQVESPDLACDIAQSVFIDLARKAKPLSEKITANSSLAGWLHRSTRYAALNHLRDSRRRLANERQAMEQLLTDSESSANWEQIRPALDEALDSLSDEDREALLLRYFKNQDFRAVGLALGVSDDAAQKRVSRAVERLREFFSKRNITVGASGLAVLISANAIQSAPAALVTQIIASTLSATTLATTAAAATKAIAMTTLQKTIVTATVAVLAGAGVYEAHRASQANGQVQSLQRQLSPLRAQIEGLQRDQDEASRHLATLRQERESLRRNMPELLRLRGEVSRLRAELLASTENVSNASEAKSWLARVTELKQKLEAMPQQKIPELELLSERDWLNIARDVDTKNDASVRSAFARLRKLAKEKFAPLLSGALRRYARANRDQVPSNITELQAYFDSPANPEILGRYEFVQTGTLQLTEPAVIEKSPADKMDVMFKIGADGYWWAIGEGESGRSTWSTTDPPAPAPWITQLQHGGPQMTQRDTSQWERIMEGPHQAWLAARGGEELEDPSEMLPYLKTPEEKAAWQKLMQNEEEENREAAAVQAYSADLAKINDAINAFLAANNKFPESPDDLAPFLKTAEDKARLERLLARSGNK